MRSPSASEGGRVIAERNVRPRTFARSVARAMLAGTVASAVFAPGRAFADDKRACGAAYEDTQALRLAGKLGAAHQSALTCARTSCAAFVRADCARWLGEIETSQPTVVFEVRDAAGRETTAVRVELDGSPWLDALDGRATPVDPGTHRLRFVRADGGTLDQTVQIREGEKNRKLAASFGRSPASGSAGTSDDHVEPPPVTTTSLSPAPWIIGGVGLAGLVVGGVLGGLVLHDRSVANDPNQCSPTRKLCTTAGAAAETQGRTLGVATTAAFVVGGAAVATAVVWLAVRRPAGGAPPAAVLGSALAVTPSGVSGRLQLRW